MKYTPREGRFAGQNGYGYKSIEHFIISATELSKGTIMIESLNKTLPTIANTLETTVILEAGYRSLRSGKVEKM
jgi:D-galacturonate reductase